MTVYNGKGGGFVSAGAAVFDDDTNSWTITTTSDVADSTGMGDTWEEQLSGLTDFSGTVEGNADSGGDYVAVIGTSGKITGSVVASGPNVSGTAICTSITETASIDDIGKVSASFVGNDPVGLVLAATAGAAGTTTGTKYHGKNCAATFTDSFLNILGWSYTLTAQTADSTGASPAADQTPSRTREVGFFAGTATVTTLQDATQAAKIDLDGAEVDTLVLKRTAAISALSCVGAICTNIENGQDKAGNATTNYTFSLSGVITKP